MPGWSEGRVIGFAPACRATGLTCVSDGRTGAGDRNRKLSARTMKESVSQFCTVSSIGSFLVVQELVVGIENYVQ